MKHFKLWVPIEADTSFKEFLSNNLEIYGSTDLCTYFDVHPYREYY